MTASSILRSRLDSSCEAISANLGTTSNYCQVTGEAVEPQPAQWREHEPVLIGDRAPSLSDPTTSTNKFRTRETQPAGRAQPEVDLLSGTAVVVEELAPIHRIGSGSESTLPLD